eukprot:TRINITY_DN3403_c0_g1_i2.p1 TRINITY_DN3403_c0_g1~~TRINITY_DN3403_c0_g1_i2.p1  ORF type:complete len:988 (-),score=64.64 TRINITY_DN3403_c0_g1_i2:265-3228(-)
MKFKLLAVEAVSVGTAGLWFTDAACLPHALPATRKVTVDGETMPLGLWVFNWESPIVASHVFRILAQDVLGYEVVFGPRGTISASAIWALAGCAPNIDCLHNDSLREPVRRYHLALEAWPWIVNIHRQWQKMVPERAPVRIPDIGYTGVDGTFLPASAVSEGLATAALPLQVYSSYNSSMYDPSPLFSKTHDIDASLLAACNSSAIRKSLEDLRFYKYPEAFPEDVGGYFVDEAKRPWPRCFDGNWWLAPSCRENPDKCIPWVTYTAWRAMVHMQRASLYNMPLAIGFTDNFTAYALMPRKYKVLMYWYLPDPTFVDLNMQLVLFPTDEYKAVGDGLLERGHIPQALDKWVMKGLKAKEPMLLAERMKIPPDAMDAMLKELAVGRSADVVACDWLKRQSSDPDPIWKAWIPLPTDCVEGQGWADEEERHVSRFEDATQCVWCGLGTVSKYNREANGYLCVPCAVGTYFMVHGSGNCEYCDIGRFSSTPGQTHCDLCEVGRFTSKQGSSKCTLCTAGFITEDVGTTNSSGCVCPQGLYLATASDGNRRECLSCQWLFATKAVDASSPRDCRLDLEQAKQAGLLLVAIFCSCALVLTTALFRRYQHIQQDGAMRKTLQRGLRSISMPQHPMCVMPFLCFCDLSEEELSACYEGARDRGSLLMLDSAQDVQLFQESGRKILFLSYSWTSWSRLGPNSKQVACMKAAAEGIRSMAAIHPEHLYIWLDILGIPQVSPGCTALAVDSLYVYASKADYLVVICPECVHEETHEAVNAETYKSRIWCRVEQIAHFSCHGLGTMFYSAEPGELIAIDENWIRDVVHIFAGHMTCCRLGHPSKQECDQKLLVPTVLAMYTVLLRRVMSGAPEDIQMIWKLMNADRALTFPRSFSYNLSGKVRQRELFGSTVDRIHEVMLVKGGLLKDDAGSLNIFRLQPSTSVHDRRVGCCKQPDLEQVVSATFLPQDCTMAERGRRKGRPRTAMSPCTRARNRVLY